jgi:hypothetical protein
VYVISPWEITTIGRAPNFHRPASVLRRTTTFAASIRLFIVVAFFISGGAAEPSTQLPNPNDLAIYVALKKLARSVVTDVALIVDQVCREVQIDFRLR